MGHIIEARSPIRTYLIAAIAEVQSVKIAATS